MIMPNSIALKPWLNHHKYPVPSLTELGMEIAIPPTHQTYPPSPRHSEVSTKALPPLRSSNPSDQEWREAKSPEPSILFGMKTSTTKKDKRPTLRGLDPPVTRSASDLSKEKLPPPPPTPMSKSSRKVLQLTGFNPNYEKTFHDELHHLNESDSTLSSGSAYSQDEGIVAEDDEFPPQSRAYSSSESSIKRLGQGTSSQVSSTHSLRQIKKTKKVLRDKSSRRNEVTTYEDLVAQERLRFENMGDEVWGRNIGNFNDHRSHFNHPMQEPELVLLPLDIRTRPQLSVQDARPVSRFSDHSSEDNRHSVFSSARESFTWGMRELSSPLKTKHGGSSSGKMPPPPRPKRARKFNSGDHPLKSPFPFLSSARRASETSFPSTGNDIRKSLSGSMKRIHGSVGHGIKETMVSNTARRASGPDTPVPNKTGLMVRLQDSVDVIQKGSVHLQDAVAKAKKSVTVKGDAARRRDTFLKNIQVIGSPDQTPGRLIDPLVCLQKC